MSNQGGFLIYFDETQRAEILRDMDHLESGFSDALSSTDWRMKQWEVCGLLFEPDTITHWALAKRAKKVVTGKARVAFTNLATTKIPLVEVDRRLHSRNWRNIVRTRSGVGGRVPAATWRGMKAALRDIDPLSLRTLEELEHLRDESRTPIDRPGARVVAQQRDATGVALDIFDRSHQLRREVLQTWTPPSDNLTSFLEGLPSVRVIEDQVVAHDASIFPGAADTRRTIVGAVFDLGDRTLEVFNINRHAVEVSLGVDLIYRNDAFDAWTLVQYKLMEKGFGNNSTYYRVNEAFDIELARMREFRSKQPDTWQAEGGPANYRLCGDGFYFKFCTRVQIETLSSDLLPGMYLPRPFVEGLFASASIEGPRGGRIITFENTKRHLTNTLFAELVRDGWIGTRGVSSSQVSATVRDALSGQRSVVLARNRRRRAGADLHDTLGDIGLAG